MERAWLLLVGAVSFVVAAKVHGRQIRLERELAGTWSVEFGRSNGPLVDALWSRERWLFWGSLFALVVLSIAARAVTVGPRTWPDAVVWHFFAPFDVAFTLTAALSLGRFVRALRRGVPADSARPREWLGDARGGTMRWWFALLLAVVGLGWLTGA